MEYWGVAVFAGEKAGRASKRINTPEKRRFMECTPTQKLRPILPGFVSGAIIPYLTKVEADSADYFRLRAKLCSLLTGIPDRYKSASGVGPRLRKERKNEKNNGRGCPLFGGRFLGICSEERRRPNCQLG